MKLANDEVVCGLCREIIKVSYSKRYVDSYTWGSLSGTPNYGTCCKKHSTDSGGHPTGEYRITYA